MDIMVKETERLTRLVNDVLDVAKIESGRMEWHLEKHDLRELVGEAATAVVPLFRDRRVKLKKHLPEKPVIACVDRDRIQQVIINLLSNACKFSPERTGKVEASLEQKDRQLILTIRDNGKGIPPEQLDRVFDKFHQIIDIPSGLTKGTGLGLAICRMIIEHHGGRIWVESPAGSGAVFFCELVAVRSAEEP